MVKNILFEKNNQFWIFLVALSFRRATSLELPMAMRFRHLEKTSKEAVGVYRSAQNYICKMITILCNA